MSTYANTLQLFAPSPIFENPLIQVVMLSTCLSMPMPRLDHLLKDLLKNVISILLFRDSDASDEYKNRKVHLDSRGAIPQAKLSG